MLYQAEDHLAVEGKGWFAEDTATEMVLFPAGFATLIHQSERDRYLRQAGQLSQDARNLPLGWVGRQVNP